MGKSERVHQQSSSGNYPKSEKKSKQKWMTDEIRNLMENRRECERNSEE